MLIGFTHKTSKILPRIFCRKFRHCAVIVNVQSSKCKVQLVMLQFVRPGKIELIPLSIRDIKILEQYGWLFLKYETRNVGCVINHNKIPHPTSLMKHLTCVHYAKHILDIHNPFIITPDGLYEYLVRIQAE